MKRKTPISLSPILIGLLITLITGCSVFGNERNKSSDANLQHRSDSSRLGNCDQYKTTYSIDNGEEYYDGNAGANGANSANLSDSGAFRSDAPDRYVVKKGDTLWDISATFLNQPWYWPEIWHVNPEVQNPHLIYPGDVLSLYYVDGQPRIGVNRGDHKISPTIRSVSLANNQPVSIAGLQPFMLRPNVVTEDQMRYASHVVGARDDRMIYGIGDKIYVHDLPDSSVGSKYSIFRPSKKLFNPNRPNEILGYEAIYASDARVIVDGVPATVELVDSKREVLLGDRVLELDTPDMQFFPHQPPPNTFGNVISIFDALSGIAQYQVAVVDLGERDCIEPGHVLTINKLGRVADDDYHRRMRADTNIWTIGNRGPEIQLPDESAGVMLIFRSFEKVSYGLMVESTRPIRVGDTATSPE